MSSDLPPPASAVQISGLFVYPVKSCRGISLQHAQLGRRGLSRDREFLVIDEADSFLTQRNAPKLATIKTRVSDVALVLGAASVGEFRLTLEPTSEPGRKSIQRRVKVFSDQVLADDMGNDAAEWFSAALDRRCRLVRVGSSYSRRVNRDEAGISDKGEAPEISFTDAFPTLLTSESSLADLNSRLPKAIPMERFRSNIVVRGVAPFEEDNWSCVSAGEIVFQPSAACLRCVITTTDQETGMRDGVEPLRTLGLYRRAPDGSGVMFGRYLVHSGMGTLHVGDLLSVVQ